MQQTVLNNLADAIAPRGNSKINIIKDVCNTNRKIRYLHGKMTTGSTSLVTVLVGLQQWIDITDKYGIKEAIINNNKNKFCQPFHNPSTNLSLFPALDSKA